MDVLSSAEFRKRYARLTERTLVTVNGHVIGEWLPTRDPLAGLNKADIEVLARSRWRNESERQAILGKVPGGSAQAQRDDLLRKINRGR